MNTRFKHFKALTGMAIGTAFLGLISLTTCGGGVPTPGDTKYLEEFHLVNFEPQEKYLQDGALNLYVDYSTCNRLGQNSQFFQEIAASLVNKTSAYSTVVSPPLDNASLIDFASTYLCPRL